MDLSYIFKRKERSLTCFEISRPGKFSVLVFSYKSLSLIPYKSLYKEKFLGLKFIFLFKKY